MTMTIVMAGFYCLGDIVSLMNLVALCLILEGKYHTSSSNFNFNLDKNFQCEGFARDTPQNLTKYVRKCVELPKIAKKKRKDSKIFFKKVPYFFQN